MNILLIALSFSLICYSNGTEEENILNRKFMDLEALPLEKLLEMKKELRKKNCPAVRRMTMATETAEQNAAAPNAMALRRLAVSPGPSADSSVQTAFQMSLTILSFLAFGGYVITMVAQNMRTSHRNGGVGMTAPLPLKTVVVNQYKQPAVSRPTGTLTTVSFGRRKRSWRFL